MGRPRGPEIVRYVFRLSEKAKDKMDKVAPPAERARSPFIREAIEGFLEKTQVDLTPRPHMSGRLINYVQVCATLAPEMVDAIKNKYPETSVSVVIQAAVINELENRS